MENLSPIQKTFVTRMTAEGPGAIAVLRIWGSQAEEIVNQLFKPRRSDIPFSQTQLNRLRLGWFLGDEVVAVKIPDRVTNQTEIEIQGHGSPLLIKRIIEELASIDVVETSQEHYLKAHGVKKLERLAYQQISQTSTTKSARILWYMAQGRLRQCLQRIVNQIDEDQPRQALEELTALQDSALWAKSLSSGFIVALCGEPNVGKSTLVNALAGFHRVMVSPIPGTTRDVIEIPMSIEGWPVVLADMAGLRESTPDSLERAGISKALSRQHQAHLVLEMIQAGQSVIPSQNEGMIRNLRVWTKADLNPDFQTQSHNECLISAQTGSGLDNLMHRIIEMIIPKEWIDGKYPSRGIVFDEWIESGVALARQAIEMGQLKDAQYHLLDLLRA